MGTDEMSYRDWRWLGGIDDGVILRFTGSGNEYVVRRHAWNPYRVFLEPCGKQEHLDMSYANLARKLKAGAVEVAGEEDDGD